MEIRSRVGVLLFSCSRPYSAVECVEAAIKAGVSLVDADLCAWDLSGAKLSRTQLDFVDLQGALLAGADLTLCSLKGAKLNRARCASVLLDGANLSGAELCGADLSGVYARKCLFTGADLRGALYDKHSLLPFDGIEAERLGMILKQ
ncbi:MAG: pentapeptide repeat-containing protein [Bdellovibrionota bacterium]